MNARTIFLLSFMVMYAVDANPNCDSLGVNFYEHIGCTPKPIKCNGCPKYYSCPQYPPVPNYCVFGSKLYKNGERIEDSDPCTFCDCSVDTYNNKTEGTIGCAVMDCAPPNFTLRPNCTYARNLSSCCELKEICPSPKNQICKVNNNTYQEGDVFIPEGTCWLCQCKKGYQEGIYKAPYCIRQSCGLTMSFQKEIGERCSPVYTKPEHGALCCPNGFICPEKIKNLKVKPSQQSGDSKTCVLGDLKVKYKEALNLTYENWDGIKNATCTCSLPPYLTCIN